MQGRSHNSVKGGGGKKVVCESEVLQRGPWVYVYVIIQCSVAEQ